MADVLDFRDATAGSNWRIGRHHDEQDGTFSQAHAAHLRGWDTTDLAWNRVPVDHSTGALKVYVVSGTETVTLSSAVSVTGTVTTSLSGTVPVTQVTSPWVTSVSGTLTVGTHAVTQGTSPWLTSQSGTTTVGNTVNVSPSGTVAVTQSTSPWLTSMSGTVSVGNAFALDSTLTGGSAKSKVYTETKGSNSSIGITGESINANVNALHVLVENGSVPVTYSSGTFPVSLVGSTTTPVTQGTTPWVVSVSGSTTVGNTVNVSQAGSFSVTQGTSPWLVSLSGTNLVSLSGTNLVSLSGTNLVSLAGTTTVGNTVTVSQGSPPWQTNTVSVAGSGAGVTSVGNSAAGTQRVVIATDQPAFTTAMPTSISGTVVQHQDTGRSQVTLYVDQATGTTAETAASISGTRANASIAASTSYVVSSGKTLRLQNASQAVKTTAATACNSRWRIRIGANSTTGAPVVLLETSTPTNVANVTGTDDAAFPDGLEFAAGTSLSFSHIESHTSSTASICVVGFEY